MSESTALQRVQPGGNGTERKANLLPALAGEMTLSDTMTLCEVLAKSGYFQDARDAAQAVVKVLAGRELGIPAIASMTGVYIVKGRVSLSANLMAGAVKRSGRYTYRVKKHDESLCHLLFFERDGDEWVEIGESRFTIEDARKAQTQNIDRFPRNMLFARAMSNGVKWHCPDVFQGPVYTPEELRGGEDEEEVASPAPVLSIAPGGLSEPEPEPASGPVPASKDDQAAAFSALATHFAHNGKAARYVSDHYGRPITALSSEECAEIVAAFAPPQTVDTETGEIIDAELTEEAAEEDEPEEYDPFEEGDGSLLGTEAPAAQTTLSPAAQGFLGGAS